MKKKLKNNILKLLELFFLKKKQHSLIKYFNYSPLFSFLKNNYSHMIKNKILEIKIIFNIKIIFKVFSVFRTVIKHLVSFYVTIL